MSFDRATFYATLRRGTLFDHGLSQRQVTGTEAILDAWDKSGFTDERWLAYMLGTAYHETGRAMYPVREGGLGKGHPYGVAAANGQVYYGRGFVQITWQTNYAKADKTLDLSGKLVADADLALEPATAAQIMMRGMTEAWFTSFKLSDYLNDHLADYLHARRIVNGMDQAETIAGYALVFFAAITAGAHKAADKTAPAVAVKAAPAVAPAAAAAPIPDPLSTILAPLQELAETAPIVADTIGEAIAPAGPSPGTSAPQTAADANTGIDIMNILAILEGLFGGVAGKISVATTVATAVPSIVEGTVANFSEAPKAIADIEKLIADIKAGKWTDAPADIHALLGEFGVILGNYGVSLPSLTGMVAALPSTPAITSAAAKPAA